MKERLRIPGFIRTFTLWVCQNPNPRILNWFSSAYGTGAKTQIAEMPKV
jgi:hypothetical protein